MTNYVDSDILRIVLPGITSSGSFTLPAGFTIGDVLVKNNTANSVTGGLKFGTSAGGTQVIAALPVAANASVASAVAIAALIAKPVNTSNISIFYDAVTSFNSSNLDICILLQRVFS